MKHVLLMVTGSIAAPKAVKLYHLLQQKYQVTVLLTPSALKFVKFPPNVKVHHHFLDQPFYHKADFIEHTSLALQHDFIVVYPATMNFLSKAALAIPDNLVLATFLASDQPKFIFPAMNNNMYLNQALQNNLRLLQTDDNITLIAPDEGMLACNVTGIGRVKEPADAFKIMAENLLKNKGLKDKTVLINYGATRTYIDDIRYISNNSSGKMGQAFVVACLQQQAKVVAIVADVNVPIIKHKNLTVIRANSNETMLAEMNKYIGVADIVFAAAALNDYLLPQKFTGKIAKAKNKTLNLELLPNIDVLKILGENKQNQLLIGFSAQDNEDENIAKNKMKMKHCDGFIMNNINTMGQDQSKITFYFKNLSYNLVGSKKQIAHDIINIISENNKE